MARCLGFGIAHAFLWIELGLFIFNGGYLVYYFNFALVSHEWLSLR